MFKNTAQKIQEIKNLYAHAAECADLDKILQREEQFNKLVDELLQDIINPKVSKNSATCPHCFGERSLGDCQVTQRLHAGTEARIRAEIAERVKTLEVSTRETGDYLDRDDVLAAINGGENIEHAMSETLSLRKELQQANERAANFESVLITIHDFAEHGEVHELIKTHCPSICASTERRHGKPS